jgi:hypothetical protein
MTTHEEKLREMSLCPYCTDGYAAEGLPCVICEQRLSPEERAACLAGAEALVLLRDLEPACYNAPSWTAWKARVAALLATETTK